MKNIKKTIAFFLLLTIVFACFSACKKSDSEIKVPAGFSLAESDAIGCYFFYPINVWLNSESGGFLSVVKADYGNDNSSVVVNRWEVQSVIGNGDNAHISLKDYWNGIQKETSEGIDNDKSENYDGYEKTLSEIADNYAPLSKEEIKVGELDAYKVVYTCKIADRDLKIMQVCIAAPKNNKTTIYAFTYTSTPENYDYNLESVDKMLESFRIK